MSARKFISKIASQMLNRIIFNCYQIPKNLPSFYLLNNKQWIELGREL